MGADDLWKCCAPEVKTKASKHFKTAQNTRVAVDVSYTLHAFIARPKNALSVCCGHPYPPNDVIESLEVIHNAFNQHSIVPIYVFDGCRHPMKSSTNQDQLAINKRKRVITCFLRT